MEIAIHSLKSYQRNVFSVFFLFSKQVRREDRQEGEWWKEGEGTCQRTYMNDSWTWTTERGLTVGERGGLGGGTEWENCNRITTTNKIKLKIF